MVLYLDPVYEIGQKGSGVNDNTPSKKKKISKEK
jgi:hypothetical protein